MHRFFEPQITQNSKLFPLSADEALHATKVLRLQAGQTIELLNGNGQVFLAEIENISKKQCLVSVTQLVNHWETNKPLLTLAVSPTKNMARYEWFIEKAVELGINTIIPLKTQRTEKNHFNTSRAQKIMISALKQSQRSFLPTLLPLTPLNEINLQPYENKLIAHCYPSTKSNLLYAIKPNKPTIIFIGPEGDFTENEVQWATQNHIISIDLGRARLRTETAAVFCCSACNVNNL